jgi:SAM-dependent methyltransferase
LRTTTALRATVGEVLARDYLEQPDEHLRALVATNYDDSKAARFSADEIDPAVRLLAELAGDGVAVEFAVGTGRLALPLAARGNTVIGIDFSEPMLDELRKKEGADLVAITRGDMTSTRVCTDAALVYLVFNTIGNLRTQDQQVACFRNAAAHLRPGGRFLIETGVPRLHRLPAGETFQPFDVSTRHLGFDEYVDPVNQILVSHHYFIDGDRVRMNSGAFRYVWPSELDLMAQLAGMTLEARWADWQRNEFTADSASHVSVWRKL